MAYTKVVRWLAVGLCLSGVSPTARATVTPVRGDPLTGSGEVKRKVLTYADLFSTEAPAEAVDDTAGFGLPAEAAAPTQEFEGALTLRDSMHNGSFRSPKYDPKVDYATVDLSESSPWKHLPEYTFRFVQNGSHLIPVEQGWAITGSRTWNLIVGPGRVWREAGDRGYQRASFPFALVTRNQNCTHNGVMTFLFNRSKSPTISRVRYQVTQETCLSFQFDMWGQVAATYQPQAIPHGQDLKNAHAAEVAGRLPTKPFEALATDFPEAGVKLSAFVSPYAAEHLTLYGVYVKGVNYLGGCETRHGTYAFCDQMRVPSYSTAKSLFAGVALMWLGQQYGSAVYDLPITEYVPGTRASRGGDWTGVTFNHVSDMATGIYNSSEFHADEDGQAERVFLTAETYAEKIAAALTSFSRQGTPGTTWVYQSHATFVLTQALDAYLKSKRGDQADLFNALRDSVLVPIGVSQGGRTTVRTDNSATGKPNGYYGMFFTADDVAKLGKFLNNDGGKVGDKQVLDPARLQESLFRTAHPEALGVKVPLSDAPSFPDTYRYHNLFWAKHVLAEEWLFPCDFWVPFLSGFGGVSILLLPNGATFYLFSDNNEFLWYRALVQLNRMASNCPE